MKLRRVDGAGRISFFGIHQLSGLLANQPVGLEPIDEDTWQLYYNGAIAISSRVPMKTHAVIAIAAWVFAMTHGAIAIAARVGAKTHAPIAIGAWVFSWT